MDRLDCEDSLLEFVRQFWSVLEPEDREFIEGWHLELICEHLEAVTDGRITRLLMNVPPGAMKSMLVSVFWPAWEWGPKNKPATRYLCGSYSESLTVRDNQRFLAVVQNEKYQRRWGDRVRLKQVGEIKVANRKTGWKIATSAGGVGTGERGDRVIIDDPHNIKDGESDTIRGKTVAWFSEVIPTRLNDPLKSAIIVIMQRVHEGDVSGFILAAADRHGYEHLMIPMRHDPDRHCQTSIGEDPRTEEGELYWPERFPIQVVDRDEKVLGPYAVAAQHQQSPSPRGGGIIKRDWWQLWPPEGEIDPDKPLWFPDMDYIVASLDTAMSQKTTADESALTIWGCWRDQNDLPKVMLMRAWAGRYEFHDLTEKVIETCRKMRVDALLIEAKANGLSVAQEVVRLCQDQEWGTSVIESKQDKLARVYAIQHLYSAGIVYAPDRKWADKVITQCEVFPKGKRDDLVDSMSQALSYLRRIGLALLREEREQDLASRLAPSAARRRIPYDV